MTQQIKNKYI